MQHVPQRVVASVASVGISKGEVRGASSDYSMEREAGSTGRVGVDPSGGDLSFR